MIFETAESNGSLILSIISIFIAFLSLLLSYVFRWKSLRVPYQPKAHVELTTQIKTINEIQDNSGSIQEFMLLDIKVKNTGFKPLKINHAKVFLEEFDPSLAEIIDCKDSDEITPEKFKICFHNQFDPNNLLFYHGDKEKQNAIIQYNKSKKQLSEEKPSLFSNKHPKGAYKHDISMDQKIEIYTQRKPNIHGPFQIFEITKDYLIYDQNLKVPRLFDISNLKKPFRITLLLQLPTSKKLQTQVDKIHKQMSFEFWYRKELKYCWGEILPYSVIIF